MQRCKCKSFDEKERFQDFEKKFNLDEETKLPCRTIILLTESEGKEILPEDMLLGENSKSDCAEKSNDLHLHRLRKWGLYYTQVRGVRWSLTEELPCWVPLVSSVCWGWFHVTPYWQVCEGGREGPWGVKSNVRICGVAL